MIKYPDIMRDVEQNKSGPGRWYVAIQESAKLAKEIASLVNSANDATWRVAEAKGSSTGEAMNNLQELCRGIQALFEQAQRLGAIKF